MLLRVETKPAVRARRSSFTLGVALLAALAVFLTVSLVSATLFIVAPGSNNASASFIHAQRGSLAWNGKDRVNILLLGIDPRANRSLPNTVTLASFDPANRLASLLSIPPNLWVTIPGYGPAKLSEAYADGGARLSILMTETVTHVAIPYYAVVNLDTLSQIVDGLGGVKINVPRTTASSPGLRPGLQILDGLSTMTFLRLHDPNPQNGVATMGREQQVLLALSQGILQSQNFAQIPTVVNNIGGLVQTNFPYDQIQTLARLVLSSHSRTHTAILSYANNAVTKYRQSNQDVLLPDWEQIRSIAQAMVPDPKLHSAATVDVLNGTGQEGVASRLADWLRLGRVRVGNVGSAASFNYGRSEVLLKVAASAGQQYVAREVAALLQMPVVTGSVGKNGAPVAVIIGHDFQDPSQQ